MVFIPVITVENKDHGSILRMTNLKNSTLNFYTTVAMDIKWKRCYACGYEGYFTARCPQCATAQ